MGAERQLLRTLSLPYEAIRTLYKGDSEVRLYRSDLTGEFQVGKRYDTLGLESTLAVNEGQLLKRIRHPYVVPVYDVVIPDGYQPPLAPVELIMPFYERGSLTDAFRNGERFSVSQAIDLMTGALLGLSELHECHQVLHRDLKSPNLFLTDDDRLLVGDLGVSIPMDGSGCAEALPSPRLYCPPETFTVRAVEREADLFQMGLVLHELANGPLPYEEYELEAMAKRLAAGRPAVLTKHLAQSPLVPSRLRRVIAKATRTDPGRRFSSAKQMADALAATTFVDWRMVVDEPADKRWEGATQHRPDRRFAVQASKLKRDSGWKLVGQQKVSSWRRMVDRRPDAICPELDSQAATDFFDSMVDIATKA